MSKSSMNIKELEKQMSSHPDALSINQNAINNSFNNGELKGKTNLYAQFLLKSEIAKKKFDKTNKKTSMKKINNEYELILQKTLDEIENTICEKPESYNAIVDYIQHSYDNKDLRGNIELARDLTEKARIALEIYKLLGKKLSRDELDIEFYKKFPEKNKKNKNKKTKNEEIKETHLKSSKSSIKSLENIKMSRGGFLKLMSGIAIATVAGVMAKKFFGDNGEITPEFEKRINQSKYEDKIRSVVLSYLSQPKFSSSDFLEQLSGTKAKLELYDLDKNNVYFSIHKKHYKKEKLSGLCTDINSINFGKTNNDKYEGDRLLLDGYVLRKASHYFFRFPSNNFRVNESDTINIKFNTCIYTMGMKTLVDFVNNKSIYGGNLRISTAMNNGRHQIVYNHGAYVAVENESSLKKLVNSISSGSSSFSNQAQKILDFVTNELSYNHSDANSRREVLKRPNEVLMTKGSDCSGLVILYASLLEQTNIDYRLIYIKGHITVAVNGEFSDYNKMNFIYDGKKFFIAETTCKGFKIGTTKLNKNIQTKDFTIIHKPGKNTSAINPHTGKKFKFV